MLGIKFLFKFSFLVRLTEPNPRDRISLKFQYFQKNIHKKFLLKSRILSKKEKKKKPHRKYHSREQIRNVSDVSVSRGHSVSTGSVSLIFLKSLRKISINSF